MKWLPSLMAGQSYKGSSIRLSVALIVAVLILPIVIAGLLATAEIHVLLPVVAFLAVIGSLLYIGRNAP